MEHLYNICPASSAPVGRFGWTVFSDRFGSEEILLVDHFEVVVPGVDSRAVGVNELPLEIYGDIHEAEDLIDAQAVVGDDVGHDLVGLGVKKKQKRNDYIRII